MATSLSRPLLLLLLFYLIDLPFLNENKVQVQVTLFLIREVKHDVNDRDGKQQK